MNLPGHDSGDTGLDSRAKKLEMRNVSHGWGYVERLLVVTDKATVSHRPCKCSLDGPARACS